MITLSLLRSLASTPLGIFELAIAAIISGCVLIVFIAIAKNFLEANREQTTRERRSIVETGTMTLFFVAYYFVARFHVGSIPPPPVAIHIIVAVIATGVIVLGTVVNLWGRRMLGSNWANQIKMYQHQTLVLRGPYRFVRHPLYASLVWMFLAGSALYWNPLLLALTLGIFVPFMAWRAKQEEELLLERFPDYAAYRRSTGMFFPRLLP